jgi:plasmid maintenance system antidote protein VapI
MLTNIQQTLQAARAVNDLLAKPLLAQVVEFHGLSIRKFAAIFGISKGHAECIIKHRSYPTLENAIRMARYFETSVEDIFGWQIDDSGDRCPLVVAMPGQPLTRITKEDMRKPLRERLASRGDK